MDMKFSIDDLKESPDQTAEWSAAAEREGGEGGSSVYQQMLASGMGCETSRRGMLCEA